MKRMLALLRVRPIWFTLLLLLLSLAYEAWLSQQAAAKLDSSHLAHIDRPADIELVLRFKPEPFHMMVLQDAGRLVKVDGPRVYLRDVPPADMRSLARRYWVAGLVRWNGEIRREHDDCASAVRTAHQQ